MSDFDQMKSQSLAPARILLQFLTIERGLIVGVIGIALAVYIHYLSKTDPDLVYAVNPAKATIVQADQSPRLQIMLDGETVWKNVTAAQIAIWNKGQEPIREKSLLAPLVIETGSLNPIIDVEILKVTREVTGLRLDKAKIGDGQLVVNWSILEQNDGAVLQLIYFGDVHTPITVSAVVERQGDVRFLKDDETKRWRLEVVTLIASGVLALLVAAMLRLWAPGMRLPISTLSSFLFPILALIFLLVVNRMVEHPTPPFGWSSGM